MGLRQLRWFVFLAFPFVIATTAQADTVYFNGSYAFASGGYGIPPYGGTWNGQAASFYCVDFTHDITANTGWNAAATSLAGSDFSATLLKDQNLYLEMAWLVTQMMGTSDTNLQAQYQYAIWSITGGPDPFGMDVSLVLAASGAVHSGFDGQGFTILTPTGSYGQEFLVKTPEPSTLLLLGIGLVALLVVSKKLLV